MTGTLRDNQYTFFILFRSIIPRMRNVSVKKLYRK